jgi:hypothetical protein
MVFTFWRTRIFAPSLGIHGISCLMVFTFWRTRIFAPSLGIHLFISIMELLLLPPPPPLLLLGTWRMERPLRRLPFPNGDGVAIKMQVHDSTTLYFLFVFFVLMQVGNRALQKVNKLG